MPAQAVAEHGAQGPMVDAAGTGAAAVVTLDQAQVTLEHPGPQGLVGHQADEVLAIDILELGVMVLAAEAVAELVVQAVGVEVIGRGVAGIALVLAMHANVLGIGGIPGGVAVQAGCGEGQVPDLPGGQYRAIEQGGQQAPVVVLEQRQVRQLRAVFEHGLGHAHLGGQAKLGVLVGRAPRVMPAGWQQAAIAAIRAGVELDPEHAQGIQAKAHGAFGVARLQVENEALGRLLALGCALRGLGVAITEVPVEVDRARLELGATVLEKTGGVRLQGKTRAQDGSSEAQERARIE